MAHMQNIMAREWTEPMQTKRIDAAKPVVVIVSDDNALTSPLDVVCDFLNLGIEHVASDQDLLRVLRAQRPMAVITEMDGRGQDGFNVMMTVSAYDPDLPIMLLTNDDPSLAGAAEAVQELWRMTGVTMTGRFPKVGQLVDFFSRAGRKAGCLRLLPV